MQILLPPSEGKTAPADDGAPPVDLNALLAPRLRSTRGAVIGALAQMCATDPASATAQLKLGARLHDYLGINQRLQQAPTAPAWQVYTGVLFDALGYADLGDAGRGRVVIFSGLWGVVGPEDQIPDYRCPAGVRLPNLRATAATYWRQPLDEILPSTVDGEFVLDLRSHEYQRMWHPPGPHATVRVLHERVVDGELIRSVVSHFNKATKGRLAADLLTSGDEPTSVDDLIDAVRALKYRAEASGPNQVDVVTTEL